MNFEKCPNENEPSNIAHIHPATYWNGRWLEWNGVDVYCAGCGLIFTDELPLLKFAYGNYVVFGPNSEQRYKRTGTVERFFLKDL